MPLNFLQWRSLFIIFCWCITIYMKTYSKPYWFDFKLIQIWSALLHISKWRMWLFASYLNIFNFSPIERKTHKQLSQNFGAPSTMPHRWINWWQTNLIILWNSTSSAQLSRSTFFACTRMDSGTNLMLMKWTAAVCFW